VVLRRRANQPGRQHLTAAGEQVQRAALNLRLADFFQRVEIDGAREVRLVEDEG
jgi:hypothetical protein